MEEKINQLKDQGFFEKTRNKNALGQIEVILYKYDNDFKCSIEITLRDT